MRLSIKGIEKHLKEALCLNYLSSKREAYVVLDKINIDASLDVCALIGRYGIETQDEKSWQKNFSLWVSPKDLKNYSYLKGCFSQYIFDKERDEMNENNKSKTRKRD